MIYFNDNASAPTLAEIIEAEDFDGLETKLYERTPDGCQNLALEDYFETPDGGTFKFTATVRIRYEDDEDGCYPVFDNYSITVTANINATLDDLSRLVNEEIVPYIGG